MPSIRTAPALPTGGLRLHAGARLPDLLLGPAGAVQGSVGQSGYGFGYNRQMDFFLPEDALQRMTPEETRITSLTAQPYPDGYRLRVNIEMTPFQKRPHLEVELKDANGDEVASSSIVEPLTWKIEFTMHIRGELNNPYTLEAKLFYPDGPTAEPQTFQFNVEPPSQSKRSDHDSANQGKTDSA